MMRIFLFFVVLVIFNSCGKKDELPAGILKPEKMEVVLWDVIKADAFTANFIARDSSKNATAENLKLQQQVFAIHKISKADFYNSYDYYKAHTPQFTKILDSMIKKADRNKFQKILPAQAY